jgi:hypothetical protein
MMMDIVDIAIQLGGARNGPSSVFENITIVYNKHI